MQRGGGDTGSSSKASRVDLKLGSRQPPKNCGESPWPDSRPSSSPLLGRINAEGSAAENIQTKGSSSVEPRCEAGFAIGYSQAKACFGDLWPSQDVDRTLPKPIALRMKLISVMAGTSSAVGRQYSYQCYGPIFRIQL